MHDKSEERIVLAGEKTLNYGKDRIRKPTWGKLEEVHSVRERRRSQIRGEGMGKKTEPATV